MTAFVSPKRGFWQGEWLHLPQSCRLNLGDSPHLTWPSCSICHHKIPFFLCKFHNVLHDVHLMSMLCKVCAKVLRRSSYSRNLNPCWNAMDLNRATSHKGINLLRLRPAGRITPSTSRNITLQRHQLPIEDPRAAKWRNTIGNAWQIHNIYLSAHGDR